MINENKSSCYPETEIYKQGVCSPYNELWASLKDISIRQENHQRTTLIVLKIYFVKLTKISGVQKPLKKTGRIPKSRMSRKTKKINYENNVNNWYCLVLVILNMHIWFF